MKYKTLIQKLRTLEDTLYENISEFIPVLHNLYLKDNSKDAKKLTESFAGYLFKIRKDTFEKEGYTEAFWSAREELDYYSEKADEMHSPKIFKKADKMHSQKALKDETGPIQEFYRDSVNYFQRNLFYLN